MTPTKPGEIWWVDLGMQRKVRPMVVLSREDSEKERALSVMVPCTTQIRGGNYEVPLPRLKWMPGQDQGVVNVLGVESVENHRLQRRAGTLEKATTNAIRERLAWLLELKHPSA